MLVDTSGFFCLYNEDEARHADALVFYDAASVRVTTNYILAEYVALAHARGSSRSDALDFSQRVLNDSEIEVVWADENLHRRAIELLLEREDKEYSLCDAVSFVVMQQLEIKEALTTDKHFEQESFVRLLKN